VRTLLRSWIWAVLLALTVPVPVPAAAAEHSGEAAAQGRSIPYRPEALEGDMHPAQVAAITLLMLGLAVAAIYALRKYGPLAQFAKLRGVSSSRLTVVESLRLSPKLTLYVIEYNGDSVILAHSGDRVATVAHYPGGAAPGTTGAPDAG
jgi:flagellar biogenesis protein FliO